MLNDSQTSEDLVLREAIKRTVAYFEVVGITPTTFEVWKWLIQPVQAYSYIEIEQALRAEVNIRCSQHLMLPSDERLARQVDAVRKERRLKWIVRWLSRMPFVEAAFACNTLAWHNTRREGDIDLFIVTKPGRVWTVRALIVIPLAILKLRPGEAKKHPIDTSFFVSSDALDLSSLRLPGEDPYFAVWINSLVPLIDRGGFLEQLREANAWATEFNPNVITTRRARAWRSSPHKNNIRCFQYLMLSEAWFEKLQRRIFPADIRSKLNIDTCVVVNDQVLKFHKNDRRLAIREAWNKLCATQ